MNARHRPMQPADIRPGVEMVAAHPVLGARYGEAICELGPAWRQLLDCAAAHARIFEDAEGKRARIWGVGVSVFVSDEFLRELKTPPFFWIGPELARRVARGHSPVLTDPEVREANSGGGLNLVVWEACIPMAEMARVEATSMMMAAFLELHRGYRLKETIASQAWAVEHLQFMLHTGSFLLDPRDQRWTPAPYGDPRELVGKPHVIGLTREIAQDLHGAWAATMFVYQPPRFGFSTSEQRLLLAALDGRTDQELSEELGISLFTVKKMWRQIYERVATQARELIPGNSAAQNGNGGLERGPEKKQHLIGYLRKHPEELRPFSRKRLRAT